MKRRNLILSFVPFVFRLPVVAPVALPLIVAQSVFAGERKEGKPRGYVDGSVFLEYADEDDSLVEVSIDGPLLKIMARAFDGREEGVANLFGDLESVTAIVIEKEGDKELDGAFELAGKLTRRLEKQGWERLARVREKDTRISVMVLNDGELILGLTVLVIEPSGGELVFANIAGRIDPASLGKLSSGMHIPGLDRIPAEAIRRSKGTSQERRSKKSSDDDDDENDDDEKWWKG